MKGQVETQVFIYIAVAVVSAGILIYGYTAISHFQEQANTALELNFQTTFTNDMRAMTFGAVQIKTYDMPSKYEQICFKAYTEKPENADADVGTKYPLIKSAIASGTDNAVFLYPKGEKTFSVGVNLELGGKDLPAYEPINFKCFDIRSGTFRIKLTGKGSSVLITEAPLQS